MMRKWFLFKQKKHEKEKKVKIEEEIRYTEDRSEDWINDLNSFEKKMKDKNEMLIHVFVVHHLWFHLHL